MKPNAVIHDRYRIVQKLGEGAMGEVFLAEHLDLKRREALKVLQVELATEREFVARFRREARVLNRVQHPNIVGVHDFGQLPDGRYFLSMEYVEGKRLDEVLREEGALPTPRALALILQVCDAVAHAHAQGIIHRDLKPENLMLVARPGGEDVVKVLDFGIAKIIAPSVVDSVPQTKLGQLFGTPHYMSPQQVQGLPIDSRTDIYAIGCILFEMLTGDTPFHGSLVELMLAHRGTSPDRPSARNPKAGISPHLDAIVLKCLEKQPDQRYPTAAELAEALRQVPGSPRPGSERGRRPWRATADFAASDETDATTPFHRLAVLPTLAPGAAPAGELLEQARVELHAAVAELAEALISRGANDIALIMAVANLKEANERQARNEADLDAVDRSIDEAVAGARRRESALRVALADLRFVLAEARDRDATIDGEIKSQIEHLEERILGQAEEHAQELRALTDRAVEAAASRESTAEQIEAIHQALTRHVDELAPQFLGDLGIEVLVDRVEAAREQVRRLEAAAGPPR